MAAGGNLLVANSALTMRLPHLVAKVIVEPQSAEEEDAPEE